MNNAKTETWYPWLLDLIGTRNDLKLERAQRVSTGTNIKISNMAAGKKKNNNKPNSSCPKMVSFPHSLQELPEALLQQKQLLRCLVRAPLLFSDHQDRELLTSPRLWGCWFILSPCMRPYEGKGVCVQGLQYLLRIMHLITLPIKPISSTGLPVEVIPNFHFLLSVFHSVAPPYLSKCLLPNLSSHPMHAYLQAFNHSVLLDSVYITGSMTIPASFPRHSSPWPSYQNSPAPALCDLTVHTQATREYQGWMRPYRASVPNIYRVHKSSPQHLWGPTVGMRTGMSYILQKLVVLYICAQSQGHLFHSGSTPSSGKGLCQNELKTLLCNFFLVLCSQSFHMPHTQASPPGIRGWDTDIPLVFSSFA